MVLLSLVVGTSCSKDVDLVDMANGDEISLLKDVEVTTISGTKSVSGNNKVLKFKDEATFQRITQELDVMPTSQRIAFADSIGFISLAKLMKEADSELEILAEASANKMEFDMKYKEYKNKYSMFLFNETDTSDLSPYFPLEDNLVANYVNENMSVMIGNKLIKGKIVNSYAEKMKTSSSVVTYAAGDVNGTYAKTSDRKVCSHLSMNQFRFTVNFTCQKKGIFGWVRYSTIYSAKFLINNFVWIKRVPMSGGIPEHLLETETNNREFYYESKEQDGNYTFDLGNIKGGSPWHATGRAKVWSRGVPEANAGTCTIDMVGQQ